MHLWLYTLFIDNTYMCQLPSATILSEYSIKEYNKNEILWPTNTTSNHFIMVTSRILEFYNILQMQILDWFATHKFWLYSLIM